MAAKKTSEASSSTSRWKYDVFLSFRGQDTRTNFTDVLFNWLDRDRILTFKDDVELNKGENISSELMAAINGSRIAIIIFSENYASSSWCLDELVKIFDCKKDGQLQKVLPVFYKVDPSDVRHQRNSYGKPFEGHEVRFKNEMERVEKWRAALTDAANLSGWHHAKDGNGHEAEVIIRKIVEEVLTIVNKTRFQVAAHPIGLDSHIEHLRCLLNDEMNVVRIIGIYGSGGIGKSTIAKAVFNDIFRNFEGSSFLVNVRELSRPPKGLALLQRKLLSDILKRKDKDIDIDNEDEGINIIEKRLCCKRVLIVLDDVADMEQFDKLVRGHDCFGPGSRIILTTRDEHLLNRPEVDEKYAVKTMNQDESLELFSFHAFRRNHPFEDFVNLSNDVIQYAGGLPLALVILGSHLYQRNQDEWESELKKISKIPNRQILEKLKISYEALDDINQTIFLDVSCFFIGKDKNFVITILDACGLEGKAGIILLTERSLITIDEDNRLRMHDMIRDMGREIVREQFPRKPGGRSRLWDNDDAIDVLVNLTGTDAVEGLQLDLYRYNVEEFGLLTIEGFSKMPNLRLLKIDIPESSINIDEEHSLQKGASCFRNLVWISWERFPFKCIPKNFHLRKLAVLDMQLSNLREVWKETKNLTKLKDLNLSSSHYLTCTPDFSGLPNLEKLILSGCKSLVEVHESIGHLKKLINLDLGHCNNLNDIPSGISKLTSLETLDISYCPKLRELPEGIGNLKRLTMLDVRETAIRELPSSFGLLKNLTVFSHALRYGIRNSAVLVSVSFDGFCSLKQLTLENCNLTDDDIPDDFWMLYSLESLNLSGNYFESLPFGIGQLSALQTLNVGFCKRLESLPMLPSSLRSLDASFCVKLKSLPNLSNLKHLLMLDLSRCKKLTEIEGLEGLKSAANIKLHMGVNLKSFAKEKIFQGTSINNVCDIFLAGDEVPKWFDFQSESFPLYCQASQPHNNEIIQGLIICIVFLEPSSGWITTLARETVIFLNESKKFKWTHQSEIPLEEKEMTWLINIPNWVWKSFAGYGDIINVSLETRFQNEVHVKKIGLNFFYKSLHENVSEENSEASLSI